MPSSVISGAWPGRMPKQPSAPGRLTSTTVSRSNWRSGVTMMSSMDSGSILVSDACLHLLGLFQGFLDGADHVEGLLRHVVVLAFDDFLEAAHGVFDLDVLAFESGELRGDEHGLRQEPFNLAGASHSALILIGEFFDAQNGDDVLEVFVALQNGFYAAGYGVVLGADDARIENARIAGQRIHRGINTALDDLTAEVGRGVEVREGRCGSRIGVVVGGHVDGLHGRDRPGFRGGDALLQLAVYGVELWLVPDGRGQAADQRGNLRAGLHEAENVVDEQQHVKVLFIAEVFCNGEPRKADGKTRAGRLRHLTVDQSGAGLFRIAGNDDAAFGHFHPQVVAFAGALAHASENRDASVLHGDVVNQLHDQNGLADAGAAEQADLAAFQIRLDKIDDFDAGFKHFQGGGLILQLRSRAVNGIVLVTDDGPELIDGLAENIHHAAECRATDGHFNAFAGVESLHTADHALGGFHRHGAYAALAEVLLNFDGDVERLGNVEAFARDAHGVVDGRKMSGFKLNVENRSDDLDDVSDRFDCLCHALS